MADRQDAPRIGARGSARSGYSTGLPGMVGVIGALTAHSKSLHAVIPTL